MLDLIFILAIVGFFILALLYLRGCALYARKMRRGENLQEDYFKKE